MGFWAGVSTVECRWLGSRVGNEIQMQPTAPKKEVPFPVLALPYSVGSPR